MKRFFQHRPDAEYCRCESCAIKGYGADAWHPVSAEFWAQEPGPEDYRRLGKRLVLSQCLACRSDVRAQRSGVVA